MTEADREALLARIDMLVPAGLDRKTAVLQAFSECFPEEYQAMTETAKAYPGSETLLYEFLEGLLPRARVKPSRTHEEGAALPTKAENAESRSRAAESRSKAQETRQGLDALTYLVKQGIPLIGAYPSGAMIASQQEENFTADPAELAALMEGKGDQHGRAKGSRIARFYFIPQNAGLLCLDIDRKPGKRDGLRELYTLFPPDTLPSALQDIERFFPCYVSTPSGGYHLYFKYNGELIRKTDLCPEAEIKHGRPGLTAPGSRKENGAYILHGNLEDAPPLYGIILDRIAELQKQKQTKAETQYAAADVYGRSACIPRRSRKNPQAYRGYKYRNQTPKQQITLETLADEACAAYSGHHDRQVSFAGKAQRCMFAFADTLAYVKANPGIFGTDPDTENTMRSVFRDSI